MTRPATLAQILDDIRDQADILGAELRHTGTRLTRKVNQSIQRFREAVTIEGHALYLTSSSGTLTAGVQSPFAFRTLDISGITDMVRPFGLDITVNGTVSSLHHVPFQSRNDYGGGQFNGIPVAWSQYNRNSIAILPPPDTAFAYTLWYLPKATDLAADGDTFDGVAGWEDWIVWDVVTRVLIRDQYPTALAMASQYKADVMTDIKFWASRANRGGPQAIGRDTFGMRNSGRNRGRLIPPP